MPEWNPITDLEVDPATLTDGEMRWIGEAWLDYQRWLSKAGTLEKFQTQFNREWAIEAGNVERVYNLDRGVTETLIEQGILASRIPRGGNKLSPERIALIIEDALEVIEGLFAFVKSERKLSKSYIHELHQTLMRHQDTHEVVDSLGKLVERKLEKGVYKKYPNNPLRPDGEMHQYCPPEHVESEMDRLLEIAENHAEQNWPVEARAAWLHHRFTQIHPYADGNGRIARALASVLLIKVGHFPLLVTNQDWSQSYVPALERADSGEMRPLVRFLVAKQRSALLSASKTVNTKGAVGPAPPQTLEDAVGFVNEILVSQGQMEPERWRQARVTGTELRRYTDRKFEELGKMLESTQKARMHPLSHGYEIHLQTTADSWRLLVTIDINDHFRGLLLVKVLMLKGGESWQPDPDPFLITFTEPIESAKSRFEPWLDECLRQAILEWSKTL